ncbi:intraflagellar transport protein 57 homolog [Oscarella lobularis]|uniref:intraflagellar transport protein 57 homolog n=1 Tax=Oscarella lobularis TaxID=121494 RepID=UPI003313483D
MTDERRGGGDAGPGVSYQQTHGVMNDLLDKLKLLDYERHFSEPNNIAPFTRHHFSLPTNASEQFYHFSSLLAWLLGLVGRRFEAPQEFDDPNASVAQIVAELKAIGFDVDALPRHRLKQGYGEHVLYVLDSMTDKALLARKFAWKKPVIVEESDDDHADAIDDDRAELTASRLDDDDAGVAIATNEDDDDEVATGFIDLDAGVGIRTGQPDDVLVSTRDAVEWRLEVERVLPLLKVRVRGGALEDKDWRSRVERMGVHRADIERAMSETRGQLDRLHAEITRALDKIASREKYINQQLERQIEEYRVAQDKLADAQQRYKGSSGSVTELSKILSDVTEELEMVKAKMDERGTSMTDSGPLVRIKQSLQRLKAENVQMDLRMGVLEHGLNAAKMRSRDEMQRDMNAPVGGGSGRGRYATFDF